MANGSELKIMVVDDDIQWAQGLEARFQNAHIDFRPKKWLQQSSETTLTRLKPDVVLWDCTGSSEEGSDTLRLVLDMHHKKPTLPMLLVVDFQETDFTQPFEEMASIDLVRTPVNLDEVMYRMRRLLRDMIGSKAVRHMQQTPPMAKTQTTESTSLDLRNRSFPHLALDLYDPGSGRLDAKKICALFGMKLADLAHLLQQKLPTLSKTPDAPSIQSGLTLFQRIGLALIRLVGSPEGIRLWMNAPNPELEGKTPCAVVLSGQEDVV
ncbi:MAG TPA: MbcA/ParS/Xre antitoxin family protein, partial [Chthonomonadaceae bacterium]|nr:MbcA/ParS/Xre antitoxin family protein [Chthonomonadaceae bacterium]